MVCLADRRYTEGNVPRCFVTLSLTYQLPSLAGEREYIRLVLDQAKHVESHEVAGERFPDFGWFDVGVPLHDEPYPGLFHLGMEAAGWSSPLRIMA